MSKSKYSKDPIEPDKTEAIILKLLTPKQRKDLAEEIKEFRIDFNGADIEAFMCAILWATIVSDHETINMTPFHRRNAIHFLGRVTSLLLSVNPPKRPKLKK